MKTLDGDEAVLYRASPWYMGLEWYDFAMVEFVDTNDAVQTYPSLLLGFVEFPKGHELSIDKECTNYAVVRTAKQKLEWKTVEEEFISKFTLCDDDESLCIVPTTAIVHPLLVFDDLGGDSKDYFCSLPRRNWSRYFGDKIEC